MKKDSLEALKFVKSFNETVQQLNATRKTCLDPRRP